MDVSIVIPLYNEEESVDPLCEAIVNAMDPLGYEYEAVLVDDGSADQTFEKARDIATSDTRFRIVKLSSNSGQTAALYAGLEQARGEFIITMDGDLQNDPDDIGHFMSKIKEGYDIVTGIREKRQDRMVSRKIPSRIANWLIRKVMGTPIKDNGCALRAYRTEVIRKFRLYSEMHRLLPTMLALSGARITQVNVKHHPRQFGQSKYGLSRIYKVLIDLIALKTVMTSSRMPFFGFGMLAVVSAFIGMIAFAFTIVSMITQPEISVFVYLGTSMLWGLLSISLLVFGALCNLVYTEANYKTESLLKVDEL